MMLSCACAAFAQEAPGTPKKDTAPATTSTGTAQPGKEQPKFPLKSDALSEIKDGFEDLDDDQNVAAMHYDNEPMQEIVAALRASSMEHLKESVDSSATFKKIFNHAEEYRGHVVEFDGTLKFIYEHPENIDVGGEKIPLARGHITTSYQVLTYVSLEPLPAGMKIGDAVRVTGVYMQRHAYISSEMPGQKLTWAPLLVVKKLEPIALKEEAPPKTAWFIGYILFGGIAVVLVLTGLSRRRELVARRNVFTQMKNSRDNDGKSRLFPKAGAPKK